MLDAIILRYSENARKRLYDIVGADNLLPQQKLLSCLTSLHQPDDVSMELMEQIHAKENALLQQKLLTAMLTSLVPPIAELIKADNNHSIFEVDYPEEMSEMLLCYTVMIIDGNTLNLDKEAKQRRVQAVVKAMELLLGMEKNSLDLYMKELGV